MCFSCSNRYVTQRTVKKNCSIFFTDIEIPPPSKSSWYSCEYVSILKFEKKRRTPHGVKYTAHFTQSSRRRLLSLRPLTPPYVRFRIRRFLICFEVQPVSQAVTRVPVGQRISSEKPDSCGMLRSSTMVLCRSWRISTRVPQLTLASSVLSPLYKGVSIDAI